MNVQKGFKAFFFFFFIDCHFSGQPEQLFQHVLYFFTYIHSAVQVTTVRTLSKQGYILFYKSSYV